MEIIQNKMAASEKKYGLFIPRTVKRASTVNVANVFGEDDDDKVQNKSQKGITSKYGNTSDNKNILKRQTQLDIDKALAQDPTAFEYDSVYDNMVGKEKMKATKVIDNKPKYIEQLLKASEQRQKEEEKRNERKIQKERVAEGEQFIDKEIFVTSAYKKKLEENQAEEEREKREAELEAKLDVTKQKDLSGFYRYILNEKTKPELEDKEVKDVKKEPLSSDSEEKDQEEQVHHRSKLSSSNDKREVQAKSSHFMSHDKDTHRKRHNDKNKHDQDDGIESRSRDKSKKHERSKDKNDRHKLSRDRKKRKRSKSLERSNRKHLKSNDSVQKQSGSNERSGRKRSRSYESRDSGKSGSPDSNESRSSGSQERSVNGKHSSKRGQNDVNSKINNAKPCSRQETSRKDRDGIHELKKKEEPLPQNRKHSRDKDGCRFRSDSKLPNDSADEESNLKNGDKHIIKNTTTTETASKYARKTTDEQLKDAKKRYLVRKLAKERALLEIPAQ